MTPSQAVRSPGGVPENFNHGREGLKSEMFNMSTFMGTDSYSLPVVTLRVERLGSRSPQTITCYASDFPSIPPVCIPSDLRQLKFGNVSPGEDDNVPARLLLGAEYSNLHPKPVKTPALLKGHQRLVAFKSHFSGRLLLAGRMNEDLTAG